MRIVIATRKSPLALWQAEHVKALLCAAHAGLEVVVSGMSTEGDRRLGVPLSAVGGKGLFVKELEQAMLDGEADLAVHSMKDVPAELPNGFTLGAILRRADPRDALVSHARYSVATLPRGARIGTSSLRRRTQLLAVRPDLRIVEARGNVGTRLSRLEDGSVDAIVLARAGLERLGLGHLAMQVLSVEESLPAGGQGALGIEARSDDVRVLELIETLRDEVTTRCVVAEREVSRLLGAGCTMPLGAFAQQSASGAIELRACLADATGQRIIRAVAISDDAHIAGANVAEQLLRQGAREMIALLSAGADRGADQG